MSAKVDEEDYPNYGPDKFIYLLLYYRQFIMVKSDWKLLIWKE